MRVEDQMTRVIHSCRIEDPLSVAAGLLWDHDCGSLPVVDHRGHVQGMLTDRDICMAAFTTGKKLDDLRVGDTMGRNVAKVRPDESLQEAEMQMRARGVRRLPVVDAQDRLIGVLSCNDLLRWVDDGGSNGKTHHDALHLVRTLATVGRSRRPVTPTLAAVPPELAVNANAMYGPDLAHSRPQLAARTGAVRLPNRSH